MAEKSMKPINEMAAALEARKNRDGYTQRLYKAAADEHKGELLQTDLENRITALREAEERERIDLHDLDMVKRRTFEYLEACKQAAVFPSVMGLSVHGFGISRQALNQFLRRNPASPTAEFVNRTKDLMADTLTNAALYRNADPVSVIFQLKNHFEHTDRVELAPVRENPLGPVPDRDELAARIAATVIEEED